MRELMFRAWDALDEKMYYFEFDDMLNDITRPPLHPSSCDWFLMQFTGLKDKNGTEIYEGDIIKSEIDNIIDIWKVEINPYSAIASPKGLAFDNAWIKHEVIGNIYENPEVLK